MKHINMACGGGKTSSTDNQHLQALKSKLGKGK